MSDADKYRAVLEREPTDTQAFLGLCGIAEREGDWEYLAELYKYRAQVVHDDQEEADLCFKAGEIYLDKIHDVARGVETLLAGFEKDRTHAGIGDRLDAIYREAQDWEATLQILEQRLEALERSDKDNTKVIIRSDLHQQAGEIWEKAFKDSDRALNHYRKAIELDKTNLLALYGAREIYYASGKFKNAAKLCELEARVEKDTERRIALYRELAHILSENLADSAQAVVALKRALKLAPDNEEIKFDLARAIAGTSITPDTQKDHRWASDYLLRAAREAAPAESLQIARLALMAMPDSAKAMEFIELRAREVGALDELAEAYQQVIDSIQDLAAKAPVVRRLAKLYIEDVGAPESALAALKQIEALGAEEDRRAIEQLSRGVKLRASQAPPPFVPAAPAKAAADPFAAPDEGLFARPREAAQPAAPAEEMEIGDEDVAEEVVEEPRPAERPAGKPAERRAPRAMADRESPEPPDGKTVEEHVQDLHAQAERARRSGDDATAEERMVEILDYAPHDQKATTYLERRFRARGDWSSLRDLLLRSAGAPHLPPPVQTVRLREAARLSEEQLADIDGAIAAWRLIQEHDPKVRDASDALMRLYTQSERWEDLIDLIRQEAESTKSRTKRIESYKRLAEIFRIRLGDSAAAAEAYKNVLDLSPDDAEALEALDEIYLREQQYENLVPLLKKRAELARERNEKRGFLLRAAIMLRERLERPEEAYELAREILSFSPADDEVLELMESVDEEGEHWDRLVETLALRARAASTAPARLEMLRKRAQIAAHRLKDDTLAVRAWHEVLQAAPGDGEALDTLAEIHRAGKQWNALVDVLRLQLDTLSSVHDRAEVHRQIARVLEEELHQPDAAMESWRKVLDASEDVESLGALSRYYERVGDWKELIEVLKRQAPHAEDHSQRADILFKRASILSEKLLEKDEARAALRNIVDEVDPTHVPTLEALRELLVADGNYAEAADILDQQIANTTDRAQQKSLLRLLGDWARERLDDLERAMDAYERAAGLDPEDDELLDLLDGVFMALGQWEKLLKLIYMRFQRETDDAKRLDMLLRGGRICEEKLGDNVKAWPWYRQAFDALSGLEATLPAVEQAAQRMGLWREIIDVYAVLTRTADGPVKQAEWWQKISHVFEDRLNDPAQALEATLRAFGLDPDNTEYLDSVDRLGVAAQSWSRLSTVYGVLAGRAPSKSDKIALLRRYAGVLLDKAGRASEAFDVMLKALEFEPTDADLLAEVERVGEAAKRWDDLVKVYGVAARLVEDSSRKAELKLKAAAVLKDRIDDADGAVAMAMDVLRADPFSEKNEGEVWSMVRSIEEGLLTTEKGVYWNKLVELYRELVVAHRHERERQVDLLVTIARIYADEIKDVNASFDCLKEAQQINPRDEATIDKLETIARKHNFWTSLVDHYRDILDETFEMDVARMYHRRRARILEEELDRADEAAEHYWQIIQLDSSDETAFGKLLAHYERSAKWNELVNLLERKLDSTQDEARKREILLQIADLWENKIGNRFEAKDWFEQVLTIWPDDADAKAGLERLGKGLGKASVKGDADEDDDLRELISIPPPPRMEAVQQEPEPVRESAEPVRDEVEPVRGEAEPIREEAAGPSDEEAEKEPKAAESDGADAGQTTEAKTISFMPPPPTESAAEEPSLPDLDAEESEKDLAAPDLDESENVSDDMVEGEEAVAADDLVIGEEPVGDTDIEEVDPDLLSEDKDE